MKIYLIRHGQFIHQGGDDGHLTDLGRTQANRLGERFVQENINFNGVYSSTAIRAGETAEVCCARMGLVKILWSSKIVEEQPDENLIDVQQRMKEFIDIVKSKFNKESVAAFSHCFAIKYLLNKIEYDFTGKYNRDRNIVPHTGVILLEYTDSNLIITDYNPCKHLNGLESY